ncbi:MAG TPA: hypothetical protein V6D19_11385, partial [Stenomitos sp.]
MRSQNLPFWALFLVAFLVIQIFGKLLSWVLLPWLATAGLSESVGFIIFFGLLNIFIFEVFVRLQLLQSVQMPKYAPTTVEDWPHLNKDALNYYTSALEQLGFASLGDYSAPTLRGMIRVFIHPQQMCFAEVGQLQGQQIFCALSSSLESNWSVAVTNLTTTPKIQATAYAF